MAAVVLILQNFGGVVLKNCRKMKWFTFVIFASVLAVHVNAMLTSEQKWDCRYNYGTEKQPGQSCKDIKNKRAQERLSNRIYWISLAQGNQRHQEKFPVFCDMESGGWTMVFKTVSGGARTNVAKSWNQPLPSSESILAALNTNNGFKGVYKNRIVNDVNWRIFNPTDLEVRIVLYKHGVEQLVLRFNAHSSTILNWFTNKRLLESPWHDITHSTFNYFTIIGPCWHGECRDFHINHSYDGCPKDIGWLTIGNTKGCPWENRFHGNSFLYSKIGTKVNYNTYGAIGDADVFAIYVR